MTEKALKKRITAHTKKANVLLASAIVFDLLPQAVLVYVIAALTSGTADGRLIGQAGAFIIGTFALKQLFNYFAVKEAHTGAYNKLTELRLQIVEHLRKLHLGFFKEHGTGELTNIVQHDVEQVEVYLAHGLPEIMAATLLPLAIFIGMLYLEWRLALLMIAGVPLMFLVKKLSEKSMQKGFQLYFDREMNMRKELMEYVKNIAVIKAFAKEEDFSTRTLKTTREYVYWVKKSMGGVTVPMGLIDIFMEAGVVLVMIAGTVLLSRGSISVARFILSIILSAAFISAVSKTATLQHFSIVFQEAVKSIGTILLEPLASDKTGTDLRAGDIEFKNVSFDYGRHSDDFKLHNINLHIKEKTLTALAGSSGSGKSTLAHLLMGFWNAKSGSILIGGKDISQYTQESLASLIGTVQQDVILFNISIYENIAIGKSGASKEEVIDAAKKARCHDFISQLPDGYDTKVGEMGVKLSGGEKQRISIARMIIKNAPILILDEAMAAVDSENERLIGEAIEALRKDKTVITIAHHLNTIRNADRIVVMDKGTVLDSGTHEVLINRCPFYKTMVEAQNKVDNWTV